MTPMPVPKPIAPLPPTAYPDLANIRKLEAESGFIPNGGTIERGRVLELARSQLGLSKDTNPTYVNQTFSQGQDNDWCADFVSTILEWAGGSPWGHLSRVQDIYTWALSNHRLMREPEPADVVVFSYGGNGFDHVALVESVNPDGTVTTIGGNEGHAASAYKTSGSVLRSVYHLEDRRILGFVDPVVGTMGPGRISGNAPLPPLPSPPF
jgi:surface antigen